MGPMQRDPTANAPTADPSSARRPRLAAVVAIVVVSLLADGEVRNGATRLVTASLTRLTSESPGGERITAARAGEGSLPHPVRAAVEMLRRHRVETYRLSAGWAEHEFVRQRMIEGAWPIRFYDDAKFELAYLAEENACEEVDRRDFDPGWSIPKRQARYFANRSGVRLARCR
jgi:hypothetical protein